MRVIQKTPDIPPETIRLIEILAMPILGFLGTLIASRVQRKKEEAAAKKILSEGVNVDADTDSKYSQNYLKWTQEFRAELQRTNEKLSQTQTDLMKVTTELSEIRVAKIALEVNYKELQIKFDTIQKQKIEQDGVIETQRIEIARLTEEVRMLKITKQKRGKNAGSSS